MKGLKKNPDLGLLLLRLMVAGLLILHAIAKMIGGIPGIGPGLEELGLPAALGYIIYIGEVVSAAFVLVGYRARLASIFLLFTLFIALYFTHSDQIIALAEEDVSDSLELQFIFGLGSLVLFFTGAGSFAFSDSNTWD